MCKHEHEHEQVSMIEFFWEFFVDVMAKKNHDVEEYFAICTWMNDIYGLKI
jgi:hypothetical protein